MSSAVSLLNKRRFLPLFVTQLLGAFNDNLYKNAMVLFLVYSVYNDETTETWFSSIATAIFILPFFLLSALAGQLADSRDKAKIIRIVKFCEILIMIVGAAGLFLAWKGIAIGSLAVPLLMLALFAMGVHSTFFGPIKYAILPQHLKKEEVLPGTGLVEAGTYIAILLGNILAGWIEVEVAAILVILIAMLGYVSGRQVPPAPPLTDTIKLDYNIWRASKKIIGDTMKIKSLFLAIIAISFFWTIGAVLFIIFPPLAKNSLTASKEVASLFLAVFSIGVAIGSVVINKLLKSKVSARYSPLSVILMGIFVVAFYLVCRFWIPAENGQLLDVGAFIAHPMAIPLLLSLLAIAISGGMFVVPLYAFLTTTVDTSQAARTIAANNIVNSGAMVGGALLTSLLTAVDISIVDQLLLAAAMCLVAAYLGWLLFKAETHDMLDEELLH